MDNLTIDFNSTVLVSQGIQEGVETWLPQDEGYRTSSFQYKAHDWDASRRVIVVSKDASKTSSTGGKFLFPQIEELEQSGVRRSQFEQYKYISFVTNMGLSVDLSWHLYNKWNDCENRIRELGNDYGMDWYG